MAYTLAWLVSRVPSIPGRASTGSAGGTREGGLPPHRREHFGTEEAALRRARELLPAAEWIDLRLFGPDGRLLADQHALAAKLAG